MRSAVEYRKYVGHMLSPDDAYRLTTQMKTFALRFTQQCRNASRLSKVIKAAGAVRKVLYPGLPEHPTHVEAVKLFANRGFGGMITFDLDGSGPEEKKDRRNRFIRSVSDKIKLIPSLGDPNTILMPVESVWGGKYPEPGMIRLSAGFEDYQELESTVADALEQLRP
jgi:cystathionine beta-lyase/cystathionine gamma-synthase